MQILEPKVESWLQNDTIDHIARCDRVCYASDNNKNNTGINEFCNRIERHASYHNTRKMRKIYL